jgi:hypothetical protein
MVHSGESSHESCFEPMICFRLASYDVTSPGRHDRSRHSFVNIHDVFLECELGVLS